MHRPPSSQWRKKAISGLLLIAFGPLLLAIILRVANETARAVVELLGPIIPYVVVSLALAGIYRLVLRRRRM